MYRKRYSFDEIMKMDQILLNLATYEASGGKMFIPKSADDVVNFQHKIANIFNYFKMMVRCGEATIDELKDMVSKKNGAVHQEADRGITESSIQKMISDLKDDEVAKKEEAKTKLGNFFSELLKAGGIAYVTPEQSGFIEPSNNPFDKKEPSKDNGNGVGKLYNKDNEHKAKRPRKRKPSNKKGKKNS